MNSAVEKLPLARIAVALGIVSLLWLGVLTKTISDQAPPVFVSVSIKTLLERHVERLGTENLSSAELQQRADAYVAALEQVIAEVSADEDVIVLVSEAVVSDDVVDLTQDVARLADGLAQTGGADGR